jgi:hypothetical protein
MESNRERIIDAISIPFEELYIQMRNVKRAHQVAYARASALDLLGGFLGVPRLYDETDTVYRNRLVGIAPIEVGSGTKSAIIAYLSNYLSLDELQFNVLEVSPGYIQIQLIEDLVSREEEIEATVARAIAAGVYYEIVYTETYWQDADSEWDTDDRWR